MSEGENKKYEIADGFYIKKYRSGDKENERDQCFYIYESDGKHCQIFYLCCDKTSKYVVIKEEDLQKAVKSIYPDYTFRTEDVVKEFAKEINYSKPFGSPEIELIKLEKSDGSANYFMRGEYSFLKCVPFLSENLSLDKQENLDKIKAYSTIGWCRINATSEILAEKMKSRGYVLEYSGRSGFKLRNSYIIKTKDGILTPEISEKMQQDLEECKSEVREDKLKAFDEYFDKQSTDRNKVYAVVETGYNYDLTRIKNDDKYEMVAQERIACTHDIRQGYDHTYQELLIHRERIKNDKRNFIIMEVPQDMIGMVVGKGGKNIKELEKKFGKKFKVVQSGNIDYMDVNRQSLSFAPNADKLKSIYDKLCMEKESKIAEQKRLEEKRAAQHQKALAELQNDIKDSLGEEIVSFSDADVVQKMVDYMKENKEKLPLQPNMQELEIIQRNLLNERNKQICEQERQSKLAMEVIFKEADRLIRNFGWENNYEIPSDEKIKTGIADFLEYRSDNQSYVRVADKAEKEIVLLLQKERLKEQMADKKFDETTSKVLEKFFNSDESGGHGEYFFSSVGKARRSSAYDYITDQVMRKLGVSDSENYPLPTIQEFRRSRYREKVIDFEKSYSGNDGYGEYNLQETKTEQSPEDKEPTLDNLAAHWGANLKTFKR